MVKRPYRVGSAACATICSPAFFFFVRFLACDFLFMATEKYNKARASREFIGAHAGLHLIAFSIWQHPLQPRTAPSLPSRDVANFPESHSCLEAGSPAPR